MKLNSLKNVIGYIENIQENTFEFFSPQFEKYYTFIVQVFRFDNNDLKIFGNVKLTEKSDGMRC